MLNGRCIACFEVLFTYAMPDEVCPLGWQPVPPSTFLAVVVLLAAALLHM